MSKMNSIREALYCATNAQLYKIVQFLKTNKFIKTPPKCFGSHRNHHQGDTSSA
jgi:hypothetical protein